MFAYVKKMSGIVDLWYCRMMQDLAFSSEATATQQYFDSYDDINIHKIMLKDASRLSAYRCFIEENCDLFANKVVLDVGSGTGILSLLAARVGARHVSAFALKMVVKWFSLWYFGSSLVSKRNTFYTFLKDIIIQKATQHKSGSAGNGGGLRY